MEYIWILVGIVGLYFGGEYLVKGSVGLSLRYGISPMIVGLTVVAFGTSAPELIVSVRSALSGHADIAFGNVVGSNIANVLLILGLPALIAPIAMTKCDAQRGWYEMMFCSILFIILAMINPFGIMQGTILLFVFVTILFMQIKRAKSGEAVDLDDVDTSVAQLPMLRIFLFILAGLILLPIGADRLVFGAVTVARDMGISEAVIGLTVVAIGTSLPELATSLNAALKGETDVAIGNVIGSSLFNIVLILGTTGMIATSTINPSLISFDIPVMLAVSALLGLFVLKRITISKAIGAAFIAAYIAYVVALVV